ncbi:MAG: RICIN domain-containing protein, partial [Coriobacteriales bacterium]|nr:RICIN domain-containing protein [Coriobacteriales bacterium]
MKHSSGLKQCLFVALSLLLAFSFIPFAYAEDEQTPQEQVTPQEGTLSEDTSLSDEDAPLPNEDSTGVEVLPSGVDTPDENLEADPLADPDELSSQANPPFLLAYNGQFLLRPLSARSRVLDVAESSRSNGGKVLLWQAHQGTNQRFDFVLFSGTGQDALYYIRNANSKLVLDVEGQATTSGTRVSQYASRSDNNANQLWKIRTESDGLTLSFVSALNPTLVLSVSGSGDTNGLIACIKTDTGALSQRFSIVDMNYVEPAQSALPTLTSGALYTISPVSNQSLVFDIPASSQTNLAAPALFPLTQSYN